MQGKKWKVPLALAIVVLGAQLIPVNRANPPVDEARTWQARAAVPPDVTAIFERACADCHSSQTRWPWYSHVAPVSWLLADHVKDGRKELNVSDWQRVLDRGPQRAGKKLGEICTQVKQGKMPIGSYLVLHPDAHLSASDVSAICAWTAAETQRISGAASPSDPR